MSDSLNEGRPTGLVRREIETDNYPYRRLRCPRCGNRGECTFSALAIVLIDGDGRPSFLAAYPEADREPKVDCHGCDYFGPLEAFTDRHRPGERQARHRRSYQ
jgi:hypothetical protein